MKWLILFCVLSNSVEAAQDTPPYDPTEVLLNVRKKVMATLERLPNYLCTETIDRSTLVPEIPITVSCDYLAKLRKENPHWNVRQSQSGHLQVDVAFSRDEGEMYSPVGKNRFPDRSLADVLATGDFGTFLTGIFAGNAASFTYNGDINFKGRTLAKFGFRVPREGGGYSVSNKVLDKTFYGRVGDKAYSAIVPYDGTFLVDPKTFDLVRLVVNAEQLPAQLKVCGVTTTLDYDTAPLNNSELLLPINARLQVTNDDGSESVSSTAFSGCHEFVGTSTLRFEGPVNSKTAGAKEDSGPLNLAAGPDQEILLLNVRKQVMATVDRLPKYLCTQTVDRSALLPTAEVIGRSCDELAKRREKPNWKVRESQSDRLRLDVAVSSEGEMYSWVGENRFRDRSLADLIGNGVISTGAFGTFLSGIFAGNAASFTYHGNTDFNGRRLVEFGFRVPRDRSSYSIGNKTYEAMVPYDGTFLVDPKTFDLVRLTVHAERLPEQLDACGITTILDYGNVRLNDFEFLLPVNARLRVINNDGSESDNRTVFSGCHEFHSESTLSFGTPSESRQIVIEKAVTNNFALPGRQHFTLVLARSIETETAAAGDTITATLKSPIKDQNKILVPKGATVKGRIVRFERLYGPTSQSLVVGVRLETIESAGMAYPFYARLATLVEGLPDADDHPAGIVVRRDLGSFDHMSGHDDPISFLQFDDVTRHYIIHRGLKMKGTTVTPHQ
jgi:hypothetical protein